MGMFKPATREQLKARMALMAPPKSGKTFCGLTFAFALAGPNGRVAVIDTENRSASKYKGDAPHGVPWIFDVCDLRHYAPTTYTAAIRDASNSGFDVLLIDSLSHAWEGVGGALEQVDKKSGTNGNSFTAWKDVTPQHREMIETILSYPGHVICTMRNKIEYVLEETINAKGKTVMAPRKVGLAPVQRQGMEYEFDIVCDLDVDHMLRVGGTRCRAIDGMTVMKPGPEFMTPIIKWLNEGVAPAPVFQSPVSTFPEAVSTTAVPLTSSLDASSVQKPFATSSQQTLTDFSPCHDGQREEIIAIASRIGEAQNWKQEQSEAWLKSLVAQKGKSKVAELTFTEAEGLIGALKAKLTKVEGEMLFSGAAGDKNEQVNSGEDGDQEKEMVLQ